MKDVLSAECARLTGLRHSYASGEVEMALECTGLSAGIILIVKRLESRVPVEMRFI